MSHDASSFGKLKDFQKEFSLQNQSEIQKQPSLVSKSCLNSFSKILFKVCYSKGIWRGRVETVWNQHLTALFWRWQVNVRKLVLRKQGFLMVRKQVQGRDIPHFSCQLWSSGRPFPTLYQAMGQCRQAVRDEAGWTCAVQYAEKDFGCAKYYRLVHNTLLGQVGL